MPFELREKRKKNTNSRIYNAALHHFCNNGYKGTTLDDVACASGVSKGLIVQRFGSKEALFSEIAVNELRKIFANTDRERPLSEDVREIIKYLRSEAEEKTDSFGFINTFVNSLVSTPESSRYKCSDFLETTPLCEQIRSAQDKGWLKKRIIKLCYLSL